jgi:hypothetical protein
MVASVVTYPVAAYSLAANPGGAGVVVADRWWQLSAVVVIK